MTKIKESFLLSISGAEQLPFTERTDLDTYLRKEVENGLRPKTSISIIDLDAQGDIIDQYCGPLYGYLDDWDEQLGLKPADPRIEIQTPKGILSAQLELEPDFPGIKLMLDGQLVGAIEFNSTAGEIQVHVWNHECGGCSPIKSTPVVPCQKCADQEDEEPAFTRRGPVFTIHD